MMGARVFVDTNVLLRATIPAFAEHAQSKALIEAAWADNEETWISRQVIREYLVFLTRPQQAMPDFERHRLANRVSMLRTYFRVADETDAVTSGLMRLIEAVEVGGKQVHDANIVATMLVYGIPTLLTQNVADFQRFSDRIQMRSPIQSG